MALVTFPPPSTSAAAAAGSYSFSSSSCSPSSSRLSFYNSYSSIFSSSIFPSGAVTVISGRLFWATLSAPPPALSAAGSSVLSGSTVYFSIDHRLVYEPFFADFGPLNLAHTYRCCKLIDALLTDPALTSKRIVMYSSHDPAKRANSAYLIGAYQVISMRRSAEQAFKPFAKVQPGFLAFRDATYGACTYSLHILDCLKGIEYAMKLGWFKYDSFDVNEYEHYEKVENGDLNWIIPKMFLAFSGPSSTSADEEGFASFTPEDYATIFKSLGVNVVIRLNKKQYDRKRFIQHGLSHVDMYFVDGSCPSRDIIHKFLELTEKQKGGIAVHCKAGLGRTGSLIGCYAMKNYRFPAAYWIGWNRICRPGSILGPQQHFLNEIQNELMQMSIAQGKIPRLPLELGEPDISERMAHMSLEEKRQADVGDDGQGDRLVHVKRHHPIPPAQICPLPQPVLLPPSVRVSARPPAASRVDTLTKDRRAMLPRTATSSTTASTKVNGTSGGPKQQPPSAAFAGKSAQHLTDSRGSNNSSAPPRRYRE
eukprot:GHVS01058337.1.p1 GENE.GHVS01058337.1~~GHVS01058337.1.p1  ORF type:complete len:536 (+),score=77.09 GHVS01058337.1:171-1778(+)